MVLSAFQFPSELVGKLQSSQHRVKHKLPSLLPRPGELLRAGAFRNAVAAVVAGAVFMLAVLEKCLPS